MTTEERFRAAVNVIKSLPKNGSFQPSPQMMLTFYAYFKQATEGPCTQKRPAFWDVIGRAKYDSWAGMGNMPKEKAMNCYVEELKKIIETMSFTDNVAEFMGSIGEIQNVDVNDLDLVAPEIMAYARSVPGSPFASREASPQRTPSYVNGTAHMNGHAISESEDEYNSADESDIPFRPYETQHISRRGRIPDMSSPEITHHGHHDTVSQQISITIDSMNQDIKNLQTKFVSLEQNVNELKRAQSKQIANRSAYPKWWPFKDVSPKFLIFVILWPIVVNRVVNIMQKRSRK